PRGRRVANMGTSPILPASSTAAPAPTKASSGRRPRFFGFDLEYSWRGLRTACALAYVMTGASCSSSLQSPGPDGGMDAAGDVSGDVSNDGALCTSIQDEYAAALAVAQQCNVASVGQCTVQ